MSLFKHINCIALCPTLLPGFQLYSVKHIVSTYFLRPEGLRLLHPEQSGKDAANGQLEGLSKSIETMHCLIKFPISGCN